MAGAGGSDNYVWIHIPVGYLYTINNPRTDWRYVTEADPGLNGRAIGYPRGKGLGGCSSINAMIYMRGQIEDYDGWRQRGNTGWGWQDVLPYFLRSEDYVFGANTFHATGGEWRQPDQIRVVSRCREEQDRAIVGVRSGNWRDCLCWRRGRYSFGLFVRSAGNWIRRHPVWIGGEFEPIATACRLETGFEVRITQNERVRIAILNRALAAEPFGHLFGRATQHGVGRQFKERHHHGDCQD
ncbi:MAG: hypothetical protein CMO26_19660 [Thiotrichales bacterium]|nr:hypothetical protein [Thiotrichales bacterium]